MGLKRVALRTERVRLERVRREHLKRGPFRHTTLMHLDIAVDATMVADALTEACGERIWPDDTFVTMDVMREVMTKMGNYLSSVVENELLHDRDFWSQFLPKVGK